eukprot:10312999-Ditylum_brightwellii.AAC.1
MGGDHVCCLCKLLKSVHDVLPLSTANAGWVGLETLKDLRVRESTCDQFGVRIDVAQGGRGPWGQIVLGWVGGRLFCVGWRGWVGDGRIIAHGRDSGVYVTVSCVKVVGPSSLLEEAYKMLQCIKITTDKNQKMTSIGVNQFFLIYAASLVFLIQAGFTMLCAGSVRIKNVQNTMLKNLLDACGACLGLYTIGYAFAYSRDNFGGE